MSSVDLYKPDLEASDSTALKFTSEVLSSIIDKFADMVSPPEFINNLYAKVSSLTDAACWCEHDEIKLPGIESLKSFLVTSSVATI